MSGQMREEASGQYVLVGPHSFPSMELEAEVAAAAGIPLVVSADAEDLRNKLAGARVVLLGTRGKVDADGVDALRACVAIARYGVGVDNVDVAAATARGIPVANIPDAATEEVATHTVGMALALLRGLFDADRSMRGGAWSAAMMGGVHRLSTLTVGIVGAGRIGKRTSAMFAGLGARVIVHDSYVQPADLETVTLEQLFRRADIISLHIPLTEETRHLVRTETIAAMRPGAILINVSRGALVDEAAVASALHDGRLGGLGLDVFASEPLPPDSPLRDAPRSILTPHVAWRSEESLAAYQQRACEQVGFALRGERMPAAVNPEVYDESPGSDG